MTTDLANITKTDLAAELDRLRAQFNELCIDAHKLEIELVGAQTEIAKLQGEITELVARPCLACATLPTTADVLGYRAALQQAGRLLDGAIRQRAMARVEDTTGRMLADESWPHFLRLVDEWKGITSTLGRRGA